MVRVQSTTGATRQEVGQLGRVEGGEIITVTRVVVVMGDCVIVSVYWEVMGQASSCTQLLLALGGCLGILWLFGSFFDFFLLTVKANSLEGCIFFYIDLKI